MPDVARGRWDGRVDRGGTFADVVARRPDVVPTAHKLPSESPEAHDDPAVQGIRDLMGPGARVPSERIGSVRMGTTVAANAIPDRKREPTLLVITRGFRKALEIGHEARADARRAAFAGARRKQFGFNCDDRPILVDSLEVEGIGGGVEEPEAEAVAHAPEADRTTRVFSAGRWRDAAVDVRAGPRPGATMPGPALVIEPHQTIVVEPGWQAASPPATMWCSGTLWRRTRASP